MMEVFYEELATISLELLPGGIGDLFSAYNSFSSGAYFSGYASLVIALLPGKEAYRAWKKYPEIKDAFKAVYKITFLWNTLLTLPGGQKVLRKLPKAWKELPGSKLARNESGLVWTKTDNGYNEFRLMEEVLNQHITNKKVPFTVMKKGGKFLGVHNKYLYKANGEYYEEGVKITLEQYEEWSHIPINQLTDAILNNFFN